MKVFARNALIKIKIKQEAAKYSFVNDYTLFRNVNIKFANMDETFLNSLM